MTFFDVYNKLWLNVCNKCNISLRMHLTEIVQNRGFGETLNNSEIFNQVENGVAILDAYVSNKLKDYKFNL